MEGLGIIKETVVITEDTDIIPSDIETSTDCSPMRAEIVSIDCKLAGSFEIVQTGIIEGRGYAGIDIIEFMSPITMDIGGHESILTDGAINR